MQATLQLALVIPGRGPGDYLFIGVVEAATFEVSRRGGPLTVEGSTALFGRAVILHFDIVDAADNEEDITAGWTFIFILHKAKA